MIQDHTTGFIILLVVNIPVYLAIGRFLFGDWEDFGAALGAILTPDTIATPTDERIDRSYAFLKMLFFAALCAGAVYGELHLIHKHFLH